MNEGAVWACEGECRLWLASILKSKRVNGYIIHFHTPKYNFKVRLTASPLVYVYPSSTTATTPMSIDPYHAVQREIQASLQSASQLQSSYTRIRSMAKEGSEELMWARNEVRSYVYDGYPT